MLYLSCQPPDTSKRNSFQNGKIMEKRESQRFVCDVPLMDEKREALRNSRTIDISQTGVGFVSARFIPINTKMMVEISLEREGAPVLIQGKVKWVEKDSQAGSYRVGMVFPDILVSVGTLVYQVILDIMEPQVLVVILDKLD